MSAGFHEAVTAVPGLAEVVPDALPLGFGDGFVWRKGEVGSFQFG